MSKMLISFLLLFLMQSGAAIAGSRNGYRLVFLDLTAAKDRNQSVFQPYFRGELKGDYYSCKKSGIDIYFDYVYIKKRPPGISDELVVNAFSKNDVSRQKLQRLLSSYRDDRIDHGFDALVLLREGIDRYQFDVLSAAPEGGVKHAEIDKSGGLNAEKISNLFCATLGFIGFAYMGL